jgi:excisionase family DNA binding protein
MVEPLNTVESAAKTLAISPWTIRAYIRQGRIKPVRIGRRVLLSDDELRRVIEEGRSQPALKGKSDERRNEQR